MAVDYDIYAEVYDLIYTGYEQDIPFYVELAQEAEPPVLELACGTGRVLIPVAEAGVSVWGLDSSTEMLEVAREKVATLPPEVQKRIRLVEGDMRDFTLEERFGLIYIPFRAFLHLLTVEDQLAALQCVRRHLKPNGRLALDIFDPNLHYIVEHLNYGGPALARQMGLDYLDPQTGQRVLVWSSRRYDPPQQRIEEERLFERLDEEGRVVERRYRTLTLRWIYRWEMEHLLARAGFEVEALYGGFQKEPFTEMGQDLVWIARPVS